MACVGDTPTLTEHHFWCVIMRLTLVSHRTGTVPTVVLVCAGAVAHPTTQAARHLRGLPAVLEFLLVRRESIRGENSERCASVVNDGPIGSSAIN